MIPTTYIRSSFLGNLKLCEHQAYITYVLGYDSKCGRRATMGTTTHKSLEVLARMKKQFDDEGKDKILYKDNEIGFEIEIDKHSFLEESRLKPIEVDLINTSRLNKSIYKAAANIEYDHVRRGRELVEHITDICIDYYKGHDHNKWAPIDSKHVHNWVWMTLDYKDGMFDPRKQKIVEPESHFDIELKYPWAEYEYFIGDQHIKGNLRLKGTIDLTIQTSDDTIEIIDYKTGEKKDWATGLPKTYKSLHNDPQLLLYYYVARQLYPDKHVQMTIFFVRDGGPYTLCFDDTQVKQALDMFEEVFNKTKKIEIPKLLSPTHSHFLCKRVCTYYKEKIDGERICTKINQEIKKNGIDYVTDTFMKKNHSIHKYQAPGAV